MATNKSNRVTSSQVKDFWKYMRKKYGFTVVQKANAIEMQAIAWALDMMQIKNHKEFMENYNTTIGTVVYVNFKIGVGNQSQLKGQIKTCVHEAQHVIQFKRNIISDDRRSFEDCWTLALFTQ